MKTEDVRSGKLVLRPSQGQPEDDARQEFRLRIGIFTMKASLVRQKWPEPSFTASSGQFPDRPIGVIRLKVFQQPQIEFMASQRAAVADDSQFSASAS